MSAASPKLLQTLGILVLLMLLYGFSRYLLEHPVLQQASTHDMHYPNAVDSYMKQASIRSFTDGFLKFQFTGKKLIRYLNSKEAQVIAPKIRVFAEHSSVPLWVAVARQAHINQDHSQIIMNHNVKISWFLPPQANRSVAMTTLETEQLTIWPKKEFTQSNEPVKITYPGAKIHAIGLKADLSSDFYQLLHQVRITINP